ncbi:hypothetical protein [Glycomyces tarimensis]
MAVVPEARLLPVRPFEVEVHYEAGAIPYRIYNAGLHNLARIA